MNNLWERAVQLWESCTPRPTIPVDDVVAILQEVNRLSAKRIAELQAELAEARTRVSQGDRVIEFLRTQLEARSNTHE